MKKIRLIKVSLPCLMLLASVWRAAAANDAGSLLQEGLFEEEANHNLEAAIQAYQSVIQQTDEQRKLAATAIFRLGECYRKLGRTNEAAAQYQRILAEFPDQPILLKLSREDLAGLGISAAPAANANPAIADSSEAAELQRIKVMIKDSPDLLNAPAEDQDRLLHKAVRNGHLVTAEFLLTNGANVNARGNGYRTPLHLAAEKGLKSMVELLLAHGADLHLKLSQGYTPLHSAAQNGHKAVAEVLLDHQADVNASSDAKITPLHLAAGKGHLAMVETLLKHGANVKAQDDSGAQPLHYAAQWGHAAVAELLLAHQAEIDARDKNNLTPLYFAVEKGNTELVDVLLKHQAGVPVTNQPFTLLHLAVGKGNLAIAERLLAHRAEVNAQGKLGGSPRLPARRTEGTPLHSAVEQGNAEMIQLLLKYHADVNARNGLGETPLLEIFDSPPSDENRLKIFQVLLANGADINAANEAGATLLFYAIGHKSIPIVKLLIDQKADLNLVNKAGKSPLTVARTLRASRPPFFVPPDQPSPTFNIDTIISLLEKAGANTLQERLTFIETTRRGNRAALPFTRQRTDEWDRHTLMEALAQIYMPAKALADQALAPDRPAAPGTPARRSPPTPAALPTFRSTSSFPGLTWPDFEHITITRWDFKSGQSKTISVNVKQLLDSPDPARDVRLDWGDAIEIPEAVHPALEEWPGLSSNENIAFYQILEREFTIVVHGRPQDFLLIPCYGSSGVASPNKSALPKEGAATSQLNCIFWLRELFRDYGYLPGPNSERLKRLYPRLGESDDLSRVRLKRVDPLTQQKREWIIDLSTIDSPDAGARRDLWLHAGDVVEVPEKKPGGN